MKKLVMGIVIGAVLVFSGQAVAETVSKIGKKVEAEYPVIVDGKELDVKAIVIDGQSTTPNRALADAVGYDVKFVDKQIIFTKKVSAIISEQTDPSLNDQITILQNRINIINSVIPGLETATNPKFNTDLKAIEDSQKKLDELLSEKSELEAQKVELEAEQ